MINESPFIGGVGKDKGSDEKLIKKLLASHSSNKGDQNKKVFETKAEMVELLNYAKKTYFAHFFLLKNYKSFEKRADRKEFKIHMNVPAIYTNNKETPWTDLSKKQEP